MGCGPGPMLALDGCCARRRGRRGAAVPAGPSASVAGADPAGVDTRPARRAATACRGRAQHPDHPARRCRLRPAGHVRRRDPHADADPAGQTRASATTPSTPRDLLADPRRAADRPQPPARRLGHDRRAGRRLGRLCRRDPEDLGDGGRGAATVRLQHRRLRQMAQHAGHRDHRDGPVRPLAHGLRLRLFLRLHGRRDLAVGAAAVREHQPDRAAARSELPPDQDLADQAIGWLRQHRAFAPDKPFFMYWAPGAGARAAPHLQGVGRQVQRQVRRWLGRHRERVFARQKATGLDSGRHAS